jgi:hypothetical protein
MTSQKYDVINPVRKLISREETKVTVSYLNKISVKMFSINVFIYDDVN